MLCWEIYFKLGTEEKVSILIFPSKKSWVNIHPNKFAEVTTHMGVCEKYWPDGYIKTKQKVGEIPANPPCFQGYPKNNKIFGVGSTNVELPKYQITHVVCYT